jgi:hypothetical protein
MLAKRGSAVIEKSEMLVHTALSNVSQASVVRTDQRAGFAFGLSGLGLFLVRACHSKLYDISPRAEQFFFKTWVSIRDRQIQQVKILDRQIISFFCRGGRPGGQTRI